MPDISTLLSSGPPAAQTKRSQVLRGQVARTATSVDEPLSVISLSMSYWQDYVVAPGHWMQVGPLPVKGDSCLILLDEDGDAHVPLYGTAGTEGGGGPGSGDKTYVHTQASANTVWTVVHNLAKFPSVEVVDTGGNWLIANVHYVDENSLTVTFGGATSGKVYVN